MNGCNGGGTRAPSATAWSLPSAATPSKALLPARSPTLRYEQEWDADDRLALRYGLGRTVHPYDGVKTTRNYVYLSLNWKF